MEVLFLILKIIMWILIFILGCICAFIFIPIEYSSKGKINDGLDAKIKIKWLFGIFVVALMKRQEDKVRAYLKLFGIKFNIPLKKISKPKKKFKKKHKYKKKKTFKEVISKKIISIIYDYLKDIIRIILPKVIRVNGTYGFSNPAVTGCLCGLMSIINEAASCNSINLQPSFTEEIIDINFKISGTIFVCEIVIKTIALILKKEVRKIIFRKKQKKLKLLNS